MTTHTLDQQRASMAWQYAKSGMGTPYAKEYKSLAKEAPALTAYVAEGVLVRVSP
jgi:hypothetical protein